MMPIRLTKRLCGHLLIVAVVIETLSTTSCPLVADDQIHLSPDVSNADVCLLELTTDPLVRIEIDSRNYGLQRTFHFPVEPEKRYLTNVGLTFPDGSKQSHRVLLESGRRVRLTARRSSISLPELVAQAGHSTMITKAAISTDDRYVLTVSPDQQAIVWDASTAVQLRTIRCSDAINDGILSADGRHLVTLDRGTNVIHWDAVTGKVIRQFATPESPSAVRLTPNGKQLVIAGKQIQFRDLNTGRVMKQFGPSVGYGGVVEVSADGARLLAIDEMGVAHVIDITSGDELRTFGGNEFRVCGAAFSANGRRVAVVESAVESAENRVRLWDVEMGTVLWTVPLPGSAGGVAMDSREKHVLASSNDPWMRGAGNDFAVLLDAITGRELRRFEGHKGGIESLSFNSDGSRVLTASADRTAVLWDTESGKRVRIFKSSSSAVTSMDISSTGRILAGTLEGTVSLWNPAAGIRERVLRGNTSYITNVRISPDDSMGLTGSDDPSFADRLSAENSDKTIGKSIAEGLEARGIKGVRSMSLEALLGDQHGSSNAVDESSVLWELATGRELRRFPGQYHDFSPGGQTVASGDSAGQVVAIQNINDGRQKQSLKQLMADVVKFSPNGRQILTAGWNNSHATLWDPVTGQKSLTLSGHSNDINAAAFSRDGQWIATASTDETIALWNSRTGQRTRSLEAHRTSVESVSFSPDSSQLVTGDLDGTVILWHLSGSVLRRMDLASGRINAAAFSPSGRELLTAAFDGLIRIWDVATGIELARLTSFGEDWLVSTPDGLFDGSYGGRQKVLFRVGDGLNVVPVDRFFQDFYYPGLLAAIWRGERPMAKIQLGDSLPPKLAIETPRGGVAIEERRVLVTVNATDMGGGIKGPSIRHNGATLIGAVHLTERTTGGIRRTFAVELVEGENHLELISASGDGSFESEPARLVISYTKTLPKSRLHLLVVGIDDYAEKSLKMKFSVNDADGIAKLFEGRGGDLYQDVLVTCLKNKAATREAILNGIDSLAAKASPQDTVVVFLSGHGTMVDNRFFFVPQEFQRTSGSLHDDLQQMALPATDIGDALAQVPALKRMIVLDTGQSGHALPVQSLTRNPFAFRGAVERLSRAQGAFTIASSAASERAGEVNELRHGILSYSFLAGLRAIGHGPLVSDWVQPTDSETVAQALDLFSFASARARQLGNRFHGQELEVQYSSSGMTFPVLPVDIASGPHASTLARNRKRPSQTVLPVTRSEPGPPNGVKGTLHVIAIGISEYSESSINLRYAAADATAIGTLFQTRHESLFDKVQLTTLLNDRATRQGILTALSEVAATANTSDTLAVFLAGHGTMVGQRYYFIPADFESSSAESTDAIVRKMGLAADELGDAISRIPASRRLLIFDTCASGGAIHLSRQGSDPFAFRSAIEQIGKSGGTFALAAVGSSGVAHEVEELQHGILSYCLLAGAGAVEFGPLADRPLQSAAVGRVDVLEWLSYAAAHVPRLTSQYFDQEQQAHVGGTGKSFGILDRRRATANMEKQ